MHIHWLGTNSIKCDYSIRKFIHQMLLVITIPYSFPPDTENCLHSQYNALALQVCIGDIV